MLESSVLRLKHRGKILLLQRNEEGRKWGLPGGKFEFRETPQKCMEREVFEETGVPPKLYRAQYIGPYESEYKGNPITVHVFDGYVINRTKSPIITLSGEHINFGWFLPNEVSELPLKGKTIMAMTMGILDKETASRLENGQYPPLQFTP